MFKKILILFFLFINIFLFNLDFSYSNCTYDGEGDVSEALETCVDETSLVKTNNTKDENGKVISSDNLEVDDGLKKVIISWTNKIAIYLAFGTIFAIAFGSLKMVLSAGEEDAIKKGKDIIKWGLIGFLGVVSAGFLISVVVKIIYSIGN